MTTPTIHYSLVKAFRILCCAGALTACSAGAAVVTWQLRPDSAVGITRDILQPGHTTAARVAEHQVGSGGSDQLSFKSAPESGATAETSVIQAAALSDKLQARDTDFEQAPPSTISNPSTQSATYNVGVFGEFASIQNFQFPSTALTLASAPANVTSSAGGDPVPVPEMSALFPIVGLIVAVSCTRILRRRRAAQLSTSRSFV